MLASIPRYLKMSPGNFLAFIFFVVFVGSYDRTVVAYDGSGTAASSVVKGTYYPSWTGYSPESIDTSLFTHIYYAFVNPNNVTYELVVADDDAVSLSDFTSTLRRKNKAVKALLSIGGAKEGPALFAVIASNASSRGVFIKSSIQVARKYGFDGLDLDWEYPRTHQEMDSLALLLTEWRFELEKEAQTTNQPRLLLTAATYFSADFFLDAVFRSYPVAAIATNLDWVNAMCYDYRGPWDVSAVGFQASFFDPNSNLSSTRGLKSWLKAGLPKEKLIMGMPLYGHSWKLKDPNLTKIGSPAVAKGPGDGFMPYSDVQGFIRNNSARVIYDPETVSTYTYANATWVSYDSVASAMVKVGLAQAMGLRGYFFWALSYEGNWEISAQASRLWIRDN
ncbi:hypothetical protein MLD38_014463 [Melastoma candidum]|uniref:Uncharacterized protein n=1 Tax=Melastoma candidum TaxID=119954 RepID=A0ACB9RER4_9MYRT|nr:hypothetical protein MLD38_014463 [Melastoma candidum]